MATNREPEKILPAENVNTKHLETLEEDNIRSASITPAISTDGTVTPRLIAGVMDNMIALGLAILTLVCAADATPILQIAACILAYLGYYFVFEGFFSRTIGKIFTGLVVIQFDGRPCTWRQTLIRTIFRVLEVNPALLGALPAALSIIFGKNHQRVGDKVAGTLVVESFKLREKVS